MKNTQKDEIRELKALHTIKQMCGDMALRRSESEKYDELYNKYYETTTL